MVLTVLGMNSSYCQADCEPLNGPEGENPGDGAEVSRRGGAEFACSPQHHRDLHNTPGQSYYQTGAETEGQPGGVPQPHSQEGHWAAQTIRCQS